MIDNHDDSDEIDLGQSRPLRRGGAAVCSGLQLRREVLGELASLNNLAGFP
jgi:hypothetical protein